MSYLPRQEQKEKRMRDPEFKVTIKYRGMFKKNEMFYGERENRSIENPITRISEDVKSFLGSDDVKEIKIERLKSK